MNVLRRAWNVWQAPLAAAMIVVGAAGTAYEVFTPWPAWPIFLSIALLAVGLAALVEWGQ